MRKQTVVLLAAVMGAGVLVAGCSRGEEEVQQVSVPKEQRSAGGAGMSSAGGVTAGDHSDHEVIRWDVPAGWKQLPGGEQQMRYATFQVSEANPDVVVTVIPLGGESGSLVGNVNRWEGQLGLPSTPEAELGKVTTTVETAAGPATLVDLKSTSGEKPLRLLGAVLNRGGVTWFYKLAGPDEVVGKEAEKFAAFTRSTRFEHDDSAHAHEGHSHEGDAARPTQQQQAQAQGQPALPDGHPPLPGQQAPAQQSTQPTLPAGHPPLAGAPVGVSAQGPAAGSSVKGLSYELPAGWAKQPDRPMRDATFTVGAGDQKAEVVISHFPQGVGDLLSNVNRWRQQVGLGPVNNVDPKSIGTAVKIGGLDGQVYDFAATEGGAGAMRQMVATCNKGGMDWFFKIIGPAGVVESNKQAFLQFLGSVRLGE